MSDRKPPRLEGDERRTLHALLQYQRDSFVGKFADLSEADARREFVPSGTTMLWLLKHMARAEELWVVQRFAGREPISRDDTVSSDDTVAGSLADYRATWTRVDAIVASASLDEPCRNIGAEAAVNLRWVVMHMLEETARHAGHLDILRELVDGVTGR